MVILCMLSKIQLPRKNCLLLRKILQRLQILHGLLIPTFSFVDFIF